MTNYIRGTNRIYTFLTSSYLVDDEYSEILAFLFGASATTYIVISVTELVIKSVVILHGIKYLLTHARPKKINQT